EQKIHSQTSRISSTNRRAPLTSTDSGNLRSCTRRRYHSRDRSHYISSRTNQEAPSRKRGKEQSNSSFLTPHNANTKSCLSIVQAISHPEALIGRGKLKLM
ncbi:hypothetical protein TNCV_2812221, partial [Trichonephila clavipes]